MIKRVAQNTCCQLYVITIGQNATACAVLVVDQYVCFTFKKRHAFVTSNSLQIVDREYEGTRRFMVLRHCVKITPLIRF